MAAAIDFIEVIEDAIDRDTCTASRIEPPWHQFLENTLPGMDRAARQGAAMICTPNGRTSVPVGHKGAVTSGLT